MLLEKKNTKSDKGNDSTAYNSLLNVHSNVQMLEAQIKQHDFEILHYLLGMVIAEVERLLSLETDK